MKCAKNQHRIKNDVCHPVGNSEISAQKKELDGAFKNVVYKKWTKNVVWSLDNWDVFDLWNVQEFNTETDVVNHSVVNSEIGALN